MEPRIDFSRVSPTGFARMRELEKYVRQCGLETPLLELVRLRASQINGCAYCVDMHTKDARAEGETEQRLYAVSVWEETPFFSERERAALAWTEAVTRIGENHVPDALYQSVRHHFDEKELVDLTWGIIAINGWNRVALSFRAVREAISAARSLLRRRSGNDRCLNATGIDCSDAEQPGMTAMRSILAQAKTDQRKISPNPKAEVHYGR